jgi:hypothetical protein
MQALAPGIEFTEISDRSLKRYWPLGITRIMLKFINQGLRGIYIVTFFPNQ